MWTHIGADEIRRIVAVDAKFTEYNSRRALRLRESEFEKRRFGGAIALRDRTRGAGYYNRVLGFGPEEMAHLDDIRAFYHEVGLVATLSLTPDKIDEIVLNRLRRRRFSLRDVGYFFTAPCSTTHGDPPTMAIRRAGPADMDVVAALWGQDYAVPLSDAVIERRAAAQWVPEFTIYLALVEGQVAAMASTYVADGIAWLGNANTFHRFRRRGCQRALIEHRIRAAAELGCDLAVVDAAFGTTSHRNIERAGMRLAFVEMQVSGPGPRTRIP